MRVIIEALPGGTTSERAFEIVERKGLGHPDAICDAVVESAARALARRYLETFGAIQHFNLDKGLLAAGSATPRFGGGTVEAPMKLVFGDRALYQARGQVVPVEEILFESARSWFRTHLRDVDPDRGLVFQNEVRPGSPQLTGLFSAPAPTANDTSAAVGFAPLTTTEKIVLATEGFLNGRERDERFPHLGEDVKVMAVRRGSALSLTVAAAFIDRWIDSEATYFRRKEELRSELVAFVTGKLAELESVEVEINTLDRRGGGSDSLYLTVTGTSAEGGDSGQVGRGNRLCGLFSTTRSSSNEAVAGKNPVSHVGKIYNVLASRIAEKLVEIEGIREASVHLVSRIGEPLPSPHLVATELVLVEGVGVEDVSDSVDRVAEAELAGSIRFAEEWIAGESEDA